MNRRRTTNSNLNRTRRLARRGFSLIEVIVAVAIIALLASIVAPRFIGSLRSSTRRAAQVEVSAIHKQVGLYLIEKSNGTLPDDFELIELTQGEDPYLNNADDLIDPWGNEYIILIPGEYNYDFDIISYGAKGQPGGEGDEADIISGQD